MLCALLFARRIKCLKLTDMKGNSMKMTSLAIALVSIGVAGSAQAASFVNGVVLPIDGGFNAYSGV